VSSTRASASHRADGDVNEDLSPEEIRRRRAALNDQTRNLQGRDDFGVDVETFDLEPTS